MKSITLYFREGSSDKVYKASIDQSGSNYLVNFAYGRRGSTLTTGTKTPNAVALAQAEKIFDKLVNEKRAKGYVEDPDAAAFTGVEHESKKTGVFPQLLNDIDEDDLEFYLTSDEWCMSEKYDGERRMLRKSILETIGINKKGLSVPLSPELSARVNSAAPEQVFILDGEALGDSVMVFDYLAEVMPYRDRYTLLQTMFKFDGTYLKLAPVAWTTEEKRALLDKLRSENAEGCVFKNVNARYKSGRPNSGGDQLKYKFVASASCIVTAANTGKRSVQLAVLDENNEFVSVGNVTVYPNQEIPQAGDIVEIRYLYYYPGGSLYQPVLLGKRNDVEKEECTVRQLKEKREVA